MHAAKQPRELTKTLLLVLLAVAMVATVMVPALDREAALAARGELGAAMDEQLADFPPVASASYVGDQYYEWSTLACPTGRYAAPTPSAAPAAVALVPVAGD